MSVRAFAARIVGRYRRRAIRHGISLPLAAAARVSTLHVVHRHTRFGDVLHARLQLHLHSHRAVVTHRAPATPRSAAMPLRVARIERSSGVAIPSSPYQVIADRLPLRARRADAVRREPSAVNALERITGADTRNLPIAAYAAALPLARSAPRISKTADSQAAPPSDAGVRDERTARVATRSTRATVPVMRAIADGEIERLAERVIGSIDRRISAQRERLGRF